MVKDLVAYSNITKLIEKNKQNRRSMTTIKTANDRDAFTSLTAI